MNKYLKNKKVHIFFGSVIVFFIFMLFIGYIRNWSNSILEMFLELLFINIVLYILSMVNGIKFVLKLIGSSLLMMIFFVTTGLIFKKSLILYISISICGFLLWLGIWLFWNGIRNTKTKVYTNEEEDTVLFLNMILFTIGTMLIVINIFEIMKIITELLKNWGYGKKNIITGASLIVSVITLLLGNIVKLKISNDSNKKDRTIELHKEINWRKELHDLEIKDIYNIRDLIKVNSFFNPKHDIRDTDIDVDLNNEIVNILTKYVGVNPVLYNKSENNKKENEPLLTLFDFNLTKDDLDQELSESETQIIREYIHQLLKNDWRKQTK